VNPRRDQALAKVCANCPVCRHARKKQHGIAFELVKKVEGRICPFGRAYERVTGRKSHEPVKTK
jgi:CxxC motif-containing protein